MDVVEYGRTGIRVSRLCFGTGHLGTFTDEDGARLLRHAHDLGVTFWDSAISYDSHRHIRAALRHVDRSSVVINTKTGAQSMQDGMRDVQRALVEMGVDYIDTMLLHGVRDIADFDARRGCLEALLEAKRHGRIRAVGLSSHLYTGSIIDVAGEDARIEVLLTAGNPDGIGLNIPDMDHHLDKIARVAGAGRGVSLMKVLAAGQYADRAPELLAWAFAIPGVHSVNVGLTTETQIGAAVAAAEARVLVGA